MREGLEGLGEIRLPAGKRHISWLSLDLPELEHLRSIRLMFHDLATFKQIGSHDNRSVSMHDTSYESSSSSDSASNIAFYVALENIGTRVMSVCLTRSTDSSQHNANCT